MIDVSQGVGDWVEWAERALASGRVCDKLASNHVVFAELAATYRSVDAVSGILEGFDIALLPLTREAAFRGGVAHAHYRSAGGQRGAILADFLIGGHASVLGATLLTRDRQRFATYFPELTLITPETDSG